MNRVYYNITLKALHILTVENSTIKFDFKKLRLVRFNTTKRLASA